MYYTRPGFLPNRSRGAKRLANGMGIGGGDFQEGLGGSARAAGVLFPFVEGADAHADELGKSGLADAHGIADSRRVGIAGMDRCRGQQFAFPGEIGHKVFGDVLELGNDFLRGIAMAALADKAGDGADENLIFITPAHAKGIIPGEAGGFFGGDFFHDLDSLIFSAMWRSR
jgi:hypothetical protein